MNRYIKEIKDNCQYVSGYRKQLKIKEIKAFEAKLNVYYEPLKAIKKLASLKEQEIFESFKGALMTDEYVQIPPEWNLDQRDFLYHLKFKALLQQQPMSKIEELK